MTVAAGAVRQQRLRADLHRPATPRCGRQRYTSYCTRCHGINLVSTSGAYFDLRTFPRDDKERFLKSMNEGKRAMPAWKGIVKPEEMEALWAYIGSVNGWDKSPATK